MKVTKDILNTIPVPVDTNTYKSVAHIDLVTNIMSNANGCFDSPPVSEDYTLTRDGKQMFGH